MAERRTTHRLARWMLRIALLPCAALLPALANAPAAHAAPGQPSGNFVLYWPNLSVPASSSLQIFVHSSAYGVYASGSGTSDASHNTPCNKYWGGGDWDGGGRLPGKLPPSGDFLHYDSPSPGWTYNIAPYGPGMKLSDAVAYGSRYGFTHDCVNGFGAIARDGLWVHKTNASGTGSYVTQGCIKLNGTEFGVLDALYHFAYAWGGVDGTGYSSTALLWS
jgi:hypothetical protein